MRLRILYATTLGRPEQLERLAYGRRPKRLPRVLGREEVAEFLACVSHRQHRLLLTTIYATGLWISEASGTVSRTVRASKSAASFLSSVLRVVE